MDSRMLKQECTSQRLGFSRARRRHTGEWEQELVTIAGSRGHWKRPLRWFICIAMILFGIVAANGQQADQLQEQLQQLKQQYEVTTHDLEQRIAALEQQIEREKEAREKANESTVSAVELAAQQAA